jgi:glucan endo-1,3-alpha-glucosidase
VATSGVSFAYQGCYTDSASRLLTGPSTNDPAMTEEKCVAFCYAQGSQTYAGLEYMTECYCGSFFSSTPRTATNCNMACGGDASEACGGGYALTLYKLSSA